MLFERRFVRWSLTLGAGLGAVTLILLVTWYISVTSSLSQPLPSSREFVADHPAPDFTLRDLDGESFHLAEEWVKGPVVLEIGSWT